MIKNRQNTFDMFYQGLVSINNIVNIKHYPKPTKIVDFRVITTKLVGLNQIVILFDE
jgi:hypothetical protein